VIDTEDVNAFALRADSIFVNSGLILKSRSEAELAGVMGARKSRSRGAPTHQAGTRGQ